MGSRVFVGIGSNMGDGVKNCMTAIETIKNDGRVELKSISSFYATSPVSEIPQDDFINCAVEIFWDGTPSDLLYFIGTVENQLGRVREVKNGPRTIDLDILLFGEAIIDEPNLTVPHKELHNRKFALLPCLEIDPDLVHPLYGERLDTFLSGIGEDQKISRLEDTICKKISEQGFRDIGSRHIPQRAHQFTCRGNMSIRDGNAMYITRRSSMLGHITPGDIVEVDIYEDDDRYRFASTESIVHRAIYQRTNALTVIHTHPPYATLLSMLDDKLIPVDSEGRYYFDNIPVVNPKNPIGSSESADLVSQCLRDHKAVMVRGHGSFVRGDTLEDAFKLTTSLEASAFFLYHLKALA